jgi:pimeloyl-ACP methyl ester carboxylesterase
MGEQTTADVVEATVDAKGLGRQEAVELARSVRVPVLVIHGDADAIANVETGRRLARLTGGEYVERPGEGHEPQSRNPTTTNAIIDRFLAQHYPAGA